MKKRSIKNLRLNKKNISNLEKMNVVIVKGGGYSWWWSDTKFIHCETPPDPTPTPEPEPTPASVFPACNSNYAHCPM